MSLLFDIHLHTRRHSACSSIDEHRLIQRAVDVGLDGLCITEHHYQWSEHELTDLANESGHPGFILLAGFEYTSRRGDILVYGLPPERATELRPGLEPEDAMEKFQRWGAACIAAHPTRASIPFDERIATMPFQGLEVESVNLEPNEQRLAKKLSGDLGVPGTGSSDAHRIEDVGAYAIEIDSPVQTHADLQDCLKRGKFRPTGKRR